MKKLRVCMVAISCLLMSLQCFAWGMQGHRIIGKIADSYLTKKANRTIAGLLGIESIAMASNWADFIKSDSNFNYLYNWHFINFQQGLSRQDFNSYLQSDTTTDAYTKIGFILDQLGSGNSRKEQQQLYLRLLIHFIGDIHQPMHTGRLEDQGGNKIRLTWFNEPTNLHRVWDEQLIGYQQLSYKEYATAINFTTRLQRTNWQQQPMSDWFYESYLLAARIYDYPIPTGGKLSYRYNFDHISIVNEQLLKAGVRLAGVLNNLFG